ncbi:hypothetical protein D4R86_04260 [bacterium]|nr:MAG: hypothetical protein D4R86_04260 [bacterium]
MKKDEKIFYEKVVLDDKKERLPEDGTYQVMYKNGVFDKDAIMRRESDNKSLQPKWWLQEVGWYLRPTSLRDELMKAISRYIGISDFNNMYAQSVSEFVDNYLNSKQ